MHRYTIAHTFYDISVYLYINIALVITTVTFMPVVKYLICVIFIELQSIPKETQRLDILLYIYIKAIYKYIYKGLIYFMILTLQFKNPFSRLENYYI